MRTFVAVGAVVMAGAGLVAQSRLAQLGLTETAARTFVLDEIKRPATSRGAPIVVAGTRAFLTLPPAARGPAATALFAWAKSYVGSPAFTASYNAYRNGRLPSERQYALSVEAVRITFDFWVTEIRATIDGDLPPEVITAILSEVISNLVRETGVKWSFRKVEEFDDPSISMPHVQ